ncbi:hypothetical protein TGRH88_047330 [Toxoplasma gondii]|uniref:EIF3F/CSN6-like C-terminal domain-containing protein n=1 Tax=Toxoplasma gondii TaxID=5811 RepID=A0A7J6K126_TOXGO|nr:hypothetical protein TGRH88_047330 [Toxoplasma gondii]
MWNARNNAQGLSEGCLSLERFLEECLETKAVASSRLKCVDCDFSKTRSFQDTERAQTRRAVWLWHAYILSAAFESVAPTMADREESADGETENNSASAVSATTLAAGTSSSTQAEVLLHPVVLFEISHHCVHHFALKERWRQGQHVSELEEDSAVLCGGILGDRTTAQQVHFRASFPLPSPRPRPGEDSGETCMRVAPLDLEFCRKRTQQLVATNPGLTLLGFYVVCSDVHAPLALHAELAAQLAALGSGFALLFDPTALSQPSGLHAATCKFAEVYRVADTACAASGSLRKAPMEIAMDEVERIVLDHIVNEGAAAGAKAETAERRYQLQVARQLRAVEELLRRTEDLKTYVARVRAGALPRNEALLRSVMSLCRTLSTCKSLPSPVHLPSSSSLSPSSSSSSWPSSSSSSPLPSSSSFSSSSSSSSLSLHGSKQVATSAGVAEPLVASMDADAPGESGGCSPSIGDCESVSEMLRDLSFLSKGQRTEGAEDASRDIVMSQLAVLLASMTEAVGVASRTHEKLLLAQAPRPSAPAESERRRKHEAW